MTGNASTTLALTRPRLIQFLAFMLVGTAAAAVDFIVVSVLVPCGAHPLVANVPAFAVAFGVSYTGHSRWTFPMGWARPGAIHRFFAVAASGFAINELLYALLLRFTGLSYRESLAVVLIAVAGATFLASKYWAFAHDRI